MPSYEDLTNALDQAWKAHDYQFALTCISELLHRRHITTHQMNLVLALISASTYSNLAAASDDEKTLKAMDRIAHRVGLSNDARLSREKADELISSRRETLSTMRWMRSIIEPAAAVELNALMKLATRDRITRVKSRLNWLVNASVVHVDDGTVYWGPAPEPVFILVSSHINGVPRLKPYLSSEWEMDAVQLEFYRSFESRFRVAERVELEGQWSYAFMLLYRLENENEGDAAALRALHARFEEYYPDSPILNYFCAEEPSPYEIGDWQRGFDESMPKIDMGEYLTLASTVKDTRLQVATVEYWTTQGRTVTPTFRERLPEVQIALQDLLDAYHDDRGTSFVEDLWTRLIVQRRPGERGANVEGEFAGFITQQEIDNFLKYHDEAAHHREGLVAIPVSVSPELINWPVPYCHTYWFEQIIRARIQAFYRDAENIARRLEGIPAVGEGWVSEMLLLKSVCDAFPDVRVLHQGRPAWLGQQSLDIYFPDHNIGVEYQGAQHSGPVSYFGGEEAYERQLERDARKRRLCLANGCHLIEVHPGYDLNSVLQDISAAVRLRD